MSQDFTPDSPSKEDRLQTYGDALADGIAPPPCDDLEATMQRVHHTLTPTDTEPADVSIPPDMKAVIWENIMHQISLAPSQRSTPVRRSNTLSAEPSFHVPASHPVMARRREWSAIVSVSVMLAIAIGLIGVFIALRFDAPWETSDGVSLFAPPTQASMPTSCTPNGDVPQSDDFSGTSLSDLPTPEYMPAERVSYEQGLAIQQTYLAYQRCRQDSLPETPPAVWPTPTSAELSYFSDRMRFILSSATLSAPQQVDIQSLVCRPVANDLLTSFPLPVNSPPNLTSSDPSAGGSQYGVATFSPSDVYLLPDGRYGAMIGTISTAGLRTPDVLTSTDRLSFVAFVEKDGRYYIDEEILVLAPDTQRPIIDPPLSDTPRTEVTYHPLENPNCSGVLSTPTDSSSPASGS